MDGTAHKLNVYYDRYRKHGQWITYCELCGLESDELFGKHCAGKVEPIVKEDVDKSDIDDYVKRMIICTANIRER